MPRYVYFCSLCASHFQVRHGMKEMQETCQLCSESGHLTRVPQMPMIKKEKAINNNSVGNVTKEYIEENRELLRDMKKEARSQEYDD